MFFFVSSVSLCCVQKRTGASDLSQLLPSKTTDRNPHQTSIGFEVVVVDEELKK